MSEITSSVDTAGAGPARRLNEMISRLCPICGLSDRSELFADSNVDSGRLGEFAFASRKLPEYMHHRLLTCTRCDLLYANPIPAPGALAAAYEEAAFDSGDEARYAAATYGRFLRAIRAAVPDLDGAMDIGTGEGAFLAQLLLAGFTHVVGIEPSTAPIAAAASDVRPLIRHELFRAGAFEPNQFSLVCCFQTLEHLADPQAICTEAFRILKPGGALFVIVHNRHALSAKLMGRRSPIFDVEHLQLFSKQSLHALFKQAGFQPPRVSRIINRYPLRYWARLFPFPSGIKAKAIGFLDATGLGRLPLTIPAGNLAAVGFRA